MIISANSLDALFTGFNTLFSTAFKGAPSLYTKVAMEAPSSTEFENYSWLGEMPLIREWIGPRHVSNLSVLQHIIPNRKFEMTVSVPRDKIEDDQFGVFGPVFAEMGRSAAMHPDELVFSLLKTGTTELAYDGQPFFDTDHPVVDETGAEVSVSNFGGGAGTEWYLVDNSRMVKPVVYQRRTPFELQRMDRPEDENVFKQDEFLYGVRGRSNAGFALWQLAYASKQALDEDSYAAARAAMSSFKGDNGRPLGVMPNILVVPPSLELAARKVVVSTTLDAGASNPWAGSAELIVSPYLA